MRDLYEVCERKPVMMKAMGPINASNVAAIAEWCGGEVKDGGVAGPIGVFVWARPGEWVVQTMHSPVGTLTFRSFDSEAFSDRYELVGVVP